MSNSKQKKKSEDKNMHGENPAEDESVKNDASSSKKEDKKKKKSADPGNSSCDELEKKVAELEGEVASLKDQMLRKQAEIDNFRKRILKDKEDAIKYSNANLLTDLITIIDDFERAIQSGSSSKDFDSFHSGIELIEKQFTGMLEKKWGLKRIESVGKEFDPQKHEAIGMEESSEYDTETVIEDYQKGYILHDRVLRPAKVKVAVPVKEAASDKKSEDNNETVAE